MRNFEFSLPTKLIFGKGERRRVGEELQAAKATRVLLHFGGGSILCSGLLDLIHSELEKVGIRWIDLGGVKPNPRLSMVREGIRICREEHVDYILAVGGGSVIDSAKAIAIGAVNEADIWQILMTWAQPEHALPVGVVLTLPAAGSETGSGLVITNEKTMQKQLYGSNAAYPRFAILDPELYLTIPPKVYGPAVCDMMSHVFERYFSSQDHTETSDGLCEAILRTLTRNIRRLIRGENTCDVWGELALSANIAHNGICGLGRWPEWCCHTIEHELSAFYDVTHGAGLAVLTPAWMKYIFKDHILLFAQFAIKVMDVEPNTRNLEEVACEGIRRLEALYFALGLPSTMTELGIPDDSLYETMAKRAVGFEIDSNRRLGSLHPPSWEDVMAIFHIAECK